jgi:hypothetical protein
MARKRPERDKRRVDLRSGKTMEVVGASNRAAGRDSGREGTRADERTRDPHRCPLCGSSLVYPTAWRPVNRSTWEVDLRCPNCQLVRLAVLDQEVAERFDDELELEAATLVEDLGRLSEANMTEDVERFVAALEADAILPSDF